MDRRTEHNNNKRLKLSDRLSALPDSTLCNILSLLSTKQSVATSILARRWKSLWTEVPILDIDERRYVSEDMSSSDIITRVMVLQRAPKMMTFRLVHKKKCSRPLLETCVAAAVMRGVQNVDLYFYRTTELPRALFTCRTVVDLMLHLCACILKSARVCLPSLKKLHLCSVKYRGDESLTNLLSGCPVLEELLFDKIMRLDLCRCRIYSDTLKRLTVNYVFIDEDMGDIDVSSYNIEINAPGLQYFKVKNCVSEYIATDNLSSLVEGDICFDLPKKAGDELHISVIRLLYNLCNAKYLKLSNRNMKVPDKFLILSRQTNFSKCFFGCSSTPTFGNLTKLEWDTDRLILTMLLEKAVNLEVLIIGEVDEDLKYWKDPQSVPACFLSRLKSITINQFGCAEIEFDMVKYLLGNAEVIKKMEIYCQCEGIIDLKTKFNALQRISRLRRSETCELDFF